MTTWAETGLLGRELLLYKKMVDQGHKVTLLTYGTKDDYKYSELLGDIRIIPVYDGFKKYENRWINLLRSFLIPFNKKYKNIFSSGNIFKTNQMSGAWVPLIASIWYGKSLVVRCGYEMLRNLLRDEKNKLLWILKAWFGYILEFFSYVSADKVIITNKSDREFIKKLFPVKQNRIALIRNFIDTERFCMPLKSRSHREKTFLFIGRLETCKNIFNLIKGTAKAGFQLDIIGKGSEEDKIRQFVKQNNYNVNFLGIFNNQKIPEIIQKYDFFILSSFFECSPKTLLEAMACGRVVIGTDVEGIRELIDDGETGFLCQIDSKSIADTIKLVFNTPEDRLNVIGSNARQFVVKECSVDRVFCQEMSVYSGLIS